MRPGTFKRTFGTETTRWIVEGFSQASKSLVYPNAGWSWTSWTPEITDTYETFANAQSAISSGYLKEMISEQEIIDIHIFEVKTTREIVEQKIITSFAVSGERKKSEGPRLGGELVDLLMGDYTVVDDHLYCYVESISSDLLYLNVVNGAWKLVLNLPDLTISERSSLRGERTGEVVRFSHLGIPDPLESPDDYNHQLAFYDAHFSEDRLTSTIELPVSS